jgi:hypothetical protein
MMGHAADSCHRIDLRQASRRLVVRHADRDAYSQVGRISDLASFEPDIVSVRLDDAQLRLEPGQTVIAHGPDRDLEVPEATEKQT